MKLLLKFTNKITGFEVLINGKDWEFDNEYNTITFDVGNKMPFSVNDIKCEFSIDEGKTWNLL
jgi:hypothetical protein